MNMRFMPFLWFFIAMSAGIVVADIFPVSVFASIGTLVFGVFLYVLLQFFFLKIDGFLKKIQLVLPLILFFLMGICLYALENPLNDTQHITAQYLKGDHLIGEVTAVSSSKSDYKKCEFQVHSIVRFYDTIPCRGNVLLFIEDPTNQIQRKSICFVNASLNKVLNQLNPGEFDSENYWKHKGILQSAFVSEGQWLTIGKSPWKVMDFFVQLREKFAALLDQFLRGDENAVAKGLILGDRSSIDSEITRKFGNTGAMHVLAVSGLHVAILVQILTLLFGLFTRWISKNQALIIALLIVWIYAALTGLSASVVRSAVMFTVLAGSTLLQKRYNGFNTLAFSAVVILCWNPHFLFDIGFQLSYLAMVGIFLFNRSLSGLFFTKIKWIQAAWEGTMVGIAAQIMTVPLTLYYFHQFPNYFILTNLGLMIFSFVILALGIALFASSWLTPFAKVIAVGLSFSMTVMLWIIDFVDGLPGAVSSGFVLHLSEVIFLFLSILSLYFALKTYRIRWLYSILMLTFCWIGFLVFTRFQRMESTQICFLQAKEPTFIVKKGNQSVCFYGNRERNPQKAKFLAESFQKVFPGTLHYHEISGVKKTVLNFKPEKIEIIHLKGGYSIDLGSKKFFLATSEIHPKLPATYVYAPWIETTAIHSLSKGALQFKW